jgi:hypothetical protein
VQPFRHRQLAPPQAGWYVEASEVCIHGLSLAQTLMLCLM